MVLPAALAAVGPALASVGSKVGSFLGSTAFSNATGAISGLGSLFKINSGRGVRDAKSMMQFQKRMQQEYTQWLNENQYSFMRTGLENAGYNPLLALGASPSEGSIGLGSPSSASGTGNDAMSILSAMATTAQIRKLDADIASKNQTVVDKVIKNVDSIVDAAKKHNFPEFLEKYTYSKAGLFMRNIWRVLFNMFDNTAKSTNNVIKGGVSYNTARSNPRLQEVFDLKDTGYSPIINSRVPQY